MKNVKDLIVSNIISESTGILLEVITKIGGKRKNIMTIRLDEALSRAKNLKHYDYNDHHRTDSIIEVINKLPDIKNQHKLENCAVNTFNTVFSCLVNGFLPEVNEVFQYYELFYKIKQIIKVDSGGLGGNYHLDVIKFKIEIY